MIVRLDRQVGIVSKVKGEDGSTSLAFFNTAGITPKRNKRRAAQNVLNLVNDYKSAFYFTPARARRSLWPM